MEDLILNFEVSRLLLQDSQDNLCSLVKTADQDFILIKEPVSVSTGESSFRKFKTKVNEFRESLDNLKDSYKTVFNFFKNFEESIEQSLKLETIEPEKADRLLREVYGLRMAIKEEVDALQSFVSKNFLPGTIDNFFGELLKTNLIPTGPRPSIDYTPVKSNLNSPTALDILNKICHYTKQ